MENKILIKTNKYIVFNKPSGVISDDNLVPGFLPCHRLDRETSGCIVLAKDKDTKELIQTEFKARRVKKTYITLVYGDIRKTVSQVFGTNSDSFTINAPVGRNPIVKVKFAVVKDGRDAVTDIKISNVLTDSGKNKYSLVTCFPKTGRTHQIRIHLNSIGHPIVGDSLYAGEKRALEVREKIDRMFLHATSIQFLDPYTGKLISVNCPLPKKLSKFLQKIQQN